MPAEHWNDALRAVADRWTDPEHSQRADAVNRTLAEENRFTEESLAFAVNQATDLIARGEVERWMGEELERTEEAAGICLFGGGPLDGFLETVGASLVFEHVLIGEAPHSPHLIGAFFDEVIEVSGEARVSVAPARDVMLESNVVTAEADGEQLESWTNLLGERETPLDRQLFLPHRIGLAVIDGSEGKAELSGLAEDALLHEGTTSRNVRLIFAPAGHSPDPVLEAMAGFREIFPPHNLTDGSLSLKAAFLEAMGVSLAVGPGFLLTRGDAEIQEGAHIRWVEYQSLAEIPSLLSELRDARITVTTGDAIAADLRGRLRSDSAFIGFGDAHRPEVGQPPLTDELRAFLRGAELPT